MTFPFPALFVGEGRRLGHFGANPSLCRPWQSTQISSDRSITSISSKAVRGISVGSAISSLCSRSVGRQRERSQGKSTPTVFNFNFKSLKLH
jgi:hypothetical protein